MNLLTLIKLQLNVSFGFSAWKWYAKKDKKKLLGGLGIVLLVVISLAPIYFFGYLSLLRMLYNGGAMLGQPHLVLTMAVVLVSIFVLVFAIGLVMSMFFFSRDLPKLIPLPFKPYEIIGSKFLVILVQEYLTVIPLLLPVLIIYGRGQGAGLYYWLAGIVVLLLVPVIPLTLVSAVILVIMRVTNLSRRKDFLRIVGMFAIIFVVLAFNMYVNRIPMMSEEELLQYFLAEDGLVNQIGRMFPPALMATRALAAEGITALANLGAFILVNLGGILLTLFLGDRLFYRGLIGGEEVSTGKKLSAGQLDKKMSRHGSPVRAIAMREIKILIRTPIYMFNSVAMLLILPLLLLVPSLSGGGGLEGITELLQTSEIRLYVNLAGAALVGMMAIFAPAASTAFSREGKMFWVSQTIPVPPRVQINGKIAYSFMITALTLPLIFLFSVLGARWTPAELAVIAVLGFLFSFPVITSSLLIDLMRPYLTWDNPQKAIKQNLNGVLGMVAGAGVFFLLYRLALVLYNQGTGDAVVYLAMAAASLVLGFVPYIIMLRVADDRFREITTP